LNEGRKGQDGENEIIAITEGFRHVCRDLANPKKAFMDLYKETKQVIPQGTASQKAMSGIKAMISAKQPQRPLLDERLFPQGNCIYTAKGRKEVHQELRLDKDVISRLANYPNPRRSIGYNDNRISLYVGQAGRCAVTRKPLSLSDMTLHHVTPVGSGGSDSYSNLA